MRHPPLAECGDVPAVPPAPRATSFAKADLLQREAELAEAAKTFERLAQDIREYATRCPRDIKGLQKGYELEVHDIHKTLSDSINTAGEVREKVEAFQVNVDKALGNAVRFTDLIARQQAGVRNLLPQDMLQHAGDVVAHLHRAKELTKSLIVKDAEEMVKVAKDANLKYSLFGPAAALAAGCAPQGPGRAGLGALCAPPPPQRRGAGLRPPRGLLLSFL